MKRTVDRLSGMVLLIYVDHSGQLPMLIGILKLMVGVGTEHYDTPSRGYLLQQMDLSVIV